MVEQTLVEPVREESPSISMGKSRPSRVICGGLFGMRAAKLEFGPAASPTRQRQPSPQEEAPVI